MLLPRQARQGRLTDDCRRIEKGYAEQNITKKEYRIRRHHQGASLSLTNCLTEHPPQRSALPEDTPWSSSLLSALLSSERFSPRRPFLHGETLSTALFPLRRDSPRRCSLCGEGLSTKNLSTERFSPWRSSRFIIIILKTAPADFAAA
jgi:hypothetical protein